MNIFISWSKTVSLQYAIETKNLIENLNPNLHAFVSEKDLIAGVDFQSEIIENIKKCDKLILCFTRETKKSPWLLFEAGYARGLTKTVIPLLFDNDPNWHSWVDNPMNIAQGIFFEHDTFSENFLRVLELPDTVNNRNRVEEYKKTIQEIKDKNRVIDKTCEDFVNKLVGLESFTIKSPIFREQTAYFFAGFESYDLLKVITESFLYTGKYLWIYGRKNMKLFGGSFKEFFKYLDEKSYNNDKMDGIDFKCLFLNPESKEVEYAHSQQEIFKTELNATLLRAKSVFGNNKRLEQCFRLYSNKREAIIIRLDNTIIYSRPTFDANGIPQLLTDTPFEVFSANSKRGQECIKTFETVWNNAEKIKYPNYI